MVVVGDEDHPAVCVRAHPFGALFGIADRVERGAVDVDAAGEQRVVAAGRRLQHPAAGRGMHA
jgi:hypothetical protein